MYATYLVAPIALIALCMALGVMQHRMETKAMSEPRWLANMTPRQERIYGTALVLFLVILGTAIEFGFQMHGASVGH